MNLYRTRYPFGQSQLILFGRLILPLSFTTALLDSCAFAQLLPPPRQRTKSLRLRRSSGRHSPG